MVVLLDNSEQMETLSYSAKNLGTVFTTDDAIATVNQLFKRQILRAEEEKSNPNEGIWGDGDAKRAFWALLDMQSQRYVFVKQCQSMAFWPRIRSLVGSPPFSFLLAQDDCILNPSGIRPNRAHMAPKESANVLTSHEIGRGHFTDGYGRVYMVIASDGARNGTLPFRAAAPGSRLVLDMKLPKQSNALRSEIRKRGDSSVIKTITFPKPNETLTLELRDDLRSMENASVCVRVRIINRQLRSASSPVIRLFCVAEAA